MSYKFKLPQYPYDQLDVLKTKVAEKFGRVIDLSIGTPVDPSPEAVKEAYCNLNGSEIGYPPSVGSSELISAISDWLEHLIGFKPNSTRIGACIGTKEFIASLPGILKLKYPEKDTVIGPALAYPTYEMGARLAGLNYEEIEVVNGEPELTGLSDEVIDRSLCLYVNSPANPSGEIYDLDRIARFAKEKNLLVVSDECYIEYNWNGNAKSILSQDCKNILAVHSLSKRSNAAGIRVGSYTGDAEVVGFLKEVRKHAGLMIPGPSQKAAAAAFRDLEYIQVQKDTYFKRLEILAEFFREIGLEVQLPQGSFYLWIKLISDSRLNGLDQYDDLCWKWTHWIALNTGVLVSPGIFYGEGGRDYVRVAAVAMTDLLMELIA